ncbi:DUF4340 domain-containing protein [Flocculibacter collagenilyticus]|uniref:DUF4340 domain-containing protein n=1 Tax=Flocculibacter collagenilyticus TaxID=2744479 RepID=UPI0018F627D2|nr:DUF4340 domain-containing protein [Flocculibacter collagenilyticus]
MGFNTFFKLIILALLLGALGLFLSMQDQGTSHFEAEYLAAEVGVLGAELSEIELRKNDELIVNAKNHNGNWLITNLNGYPADRAKLSAFIGQIKSAKKVEAKTSDPQKHKYLGLASVADDTESAEGENGTVNDFQPTQVNLVKSDTRQNNPMFSIILGNKAKGGNGQYARIQDDNQTWLIDRQITTPTHAEDWIVKALFTFEHEQIKQITSIQSESNSSVIKPNELTVSKQNEADSNFVMNDMPEGRVLQYEGILNALARSIAELSIESVFPKLNKQNDERNAQATAVNLDSLEPATQINIELYSGREVLLLLYKGIVNESDGIDNERYFVAVEDSDEESKLANWYYEINKFTYDQLNKSSEDFLAPVNQSETGDTAVEAAG